MLACVLFYSGYHVGVRKNNEYTIMAMLSLSDRFVASRAAASIGALSDVKSKIPGNEAAICKIRSEVIRLNQDWQNASLIRHASRKLCVEEMGL